MKKKNWEKSILLLITAVIWGAAFVAQSVGMEHIGPFTFTCVRNILGGLVLIPCISILNKWKGRQESQTGEKQPQDRRSLLVGGICCGIVLCMASNLQQVGILHTTVGKAGFITALYIVIVPVMGLFFKRKCGIQVWLGVFIALAGFYLLSTKGGLRPELADIYLLGSAFLFSVHILIIDHFSPKVDGVKLSCLQFFVCGILSGIIMLFTETTDMADILAAWKPIVYAGVLSSGVAYTLQIIGQKDFNPTVASLILSLESVFSALAGWLILHQALSGRELLGCVLIFCAILLAQIPFKVKKMNLFVNMTNK